MLGGGSGEKEWEGKRETKGRRERDKDVRIQRKGERVIEEEK